MLACVPSGYQGAMSVTPDHSEHTGRTAPGQTADKTEVELEPSAVDAALPTPLRRRGRAQSPSPSPGLVQRSEPEDQTQKASVACPRHRCYLRLLSRLFCAALMVFLGLAALGWSGVLEEQGHDAEPVANSSAIQEAERQKEPSWPQLVFSALACTGLRKDIFDVVAGMPYEFGNGMHAANFYKYPQLVKAAAAAHTHGKGETIQKEFFETVLQLSTGVGGWPPALSARLRKVIGRSCQDLQRCSATDALSNLPLPVTVDLAFTSKGAVSSKGTRLYQSILRLGSYVMPLHTFLRERADAFQSRPASVVLGQRAADQSIGDCFAFRDNASIALRILPRAGHAALPVVRHIVLEQPSRYLLKRPQTAPRSFAVFGYSRDADSARHGGQEQDTPYTENLGTYEYNVAAPAAQAFQLQRPAVGGVMLVFDGPGWSDDYTCLYRIRAFEAPPPSCSGGRLSFEPAA